MSWPDAFFWTAVVLGTFGTACFVAWLVARHPPAPRVTNNVYQSNPLPMNQWPWPSGYQPRGAGEAPKTVPDQPTSVQPRRR